MRFEDVLPPPLTVNWDWQLDAACREMDPETFFHPPGERSRRREQRIQHAKDVCAACPVAQQCRQHALAAMEPYGIWGGLSEEDRAAILGVPSVAFAARRQKVAQRQPAGQVDENTRLGGRTERRPTGARS